MSELVLGAIFMMTGLLDVFQKVKLGSISLNGLLTALYSLLIAYLLLIRGGFASSVLKVLRPGLLLVAWALLSTTWTAQRSTEMIQPLTVLISFVGATLLMSDLSFRHQPTALWPVRLIPKILAFATGLMVLVLIVQHVAHIQGFALANRAFAIYATLGSTWLMAGWRIGKKSNRLYVFLLIVVIAATLSRTTLATCIVIMPFMVSFRPNRLFGWVRPILTLSLLGAMALSGILATPALRTRFFEAGDNAVSVNGTSINTAGRGKIWAAVIADAVQKPWMGHGPGSSSILVDELTAGIVREPHNDYLRLFHDYGIVGLSLWLWLIFSLFQAIRRGYRLTEYYRALSAQRCIVAGIGALLSVLLCMLTDNIIVYPQPMLMAAIILGAALGASLSIQARQSPEELSTRAIKTNPTDFIA